MTRQQRIAILIALLLATSGCAQLRSGLSPAKVVSGTNKTHEMYFGMARIAERNGKIESARKAYLQILKQDPNHVDSIHRMAITSVQAQCLDEAFEYFEQAISLSEPTEELLGDYGYALYLDEQFDEAEAALKRAQQLSPDNPRIANNLALVLGRQGKYDEAFELFQRSGDRAEALANLAFVQSQAGDISYAKQNYHQALEINPKLTVAANGLYEIHRAFPSSDAMLIKPFRGGNDAQPERFANQITTAQNESNQAVSTNEVDELIRSIAIQPGTSSKSSIPNRVVQATYQSEPKSKSARLEMESSDFIIQEKEKPVSQPEFATPETAEPIEAARIPNQSRNSSRRTDSSARKNDSSRR